MWWLLFCRAAASLYHAFENVWFRVLRCKIGQNYIIISSNIKTQTHLKRFGLGCPGVKSVKIYIIISSNIKTQTPLKRFGLGCPGVKSVKIILLSF
jgi:hypothetical protein